jgi:hypothetical protein
VVAVEVVVELLPELVDARFEGLRRHQADASEADYPGRSVSNESGALGELFSEL